MRVHIDFYCIEFILCPGKFALGRLEALSRNLQMFQRRLCHPQQHPEDRGHPFETREPNFSQVARQSTHLMRMKCLEMFRT